MEKVTVTSLHKMKAEGRPITMLTSYDFPMTKIVDAAGVDIILVGDSAGNVVLGYPNTLPVTMEEMLHHTRAVARACKRAFLVADMPFMSYQASVEEAKRNAGRFLKEAGAEAVKVEGGANMAEVIRAIVNIDIPVMAHIGLTPQSVHRMGGYKVQGRDEKQRQQLMEDARAVEEAGAFSVVLECVPSSLAKAITAEVSIPTIGIGAGIHCDGQVLVLHDLLGLLGRFRPKFVKTYVNLEEIISNAVVQYLNEVRNRTFPGDAHAFS